MIKVKKSYMIVDDDAEDREFFCDAVKEIDLSAECFEANNGEDALKKLRSQKRLPYLIFLDLNMPRMDGKSCLAELKKDNLLKHIPVIIYTTSSSHKDVEETRELGASYFLTKPADFGILRKKISSLIEMDWKEPTKTISIS